MFGFLFSFSFIVLWLLFCLALSLIGSLLPSRFLPANLEEVLQTETICRTLHGKNLISDEEYTFETERVANHYNGLVFRGYLFIVAPVVKLLKATNFVDSFVTNLVKYWIATHQLIIHERTKPRWGTQVLLKACVNIAHRVGVFLFFIGRVEWHGSGGSSV